MSLGAASYLKLLPVPSFRYIFRHLLQDKRGQFRKVGRRVRFDFQLDVSPFLSIDAAAAMSAEPSSSRKQQAANARYQLVGIVEHSGTMR